MHHPSFPSNPEDTHRVTPWLPRRAFLMQIGGAAVGFAAMPGALAVRTAAAATNTEAAERLIESLGNEFLATFNRPGLSEADAIDEFGRLFRTGFDVPTIARFVLGRYWNMATTEQLREYVALFEEMVVRTYARRFAEYSGQRFTITGVRAETDTDTVVITDVVQPGNPEPVEIAWRLRQREDGPRIIDVFIESISMGVTQRQEFASVIERGGGRIEALLERMRAQVDRL